MSFIIMSTHQHRHYNNNNKATKLNQVPLKKKLKIFGLKEFLSKLFLKLTSHYIDPSIICVQILKLSALNRLPEEIGQMTPFLSTYETLMQFLSMNNPVNHNELLRQFASISFYKYSPQYTIIRRPNEFLNYFFFILMGNIAVLGVKYEKCGLTKEEYLSYLIKLRLLKEDHLYTQCLLLNSKAITEVDIDKDYIDRMARIKYDIYETKAKAELLLHNLRPFKDYKTFTIGSIGNYINATLPTKNNGLIDKDAKITFTIPRYEQTNLLCAGDFFGSLTSPNERDYHTYIAVNDCCDLAYIDIKEHYQSPLCLSMKEAFRSMCYETIIRRYYIFQSIERKTFEETYSKLFSYRFIKKGERIIMQDTINEGLFLLIKGTIEITTRRSSDEINALTIQLKHSLEGFNEFVGMNQGKGKAKDDQSKGNSIYTGENFAQLLQEKRVIRLNTVTNKEVFGLNECYDYKTKMNHFTMECISAQAEMLFLSREAFLYMFHKEASMRELTARVIENKVEFYMETIRRYKERLDSQAGLCVNNNKGKLMPYNQYYLTSQAQSQGQYEEGNRMTRKKSLRLSTMKATLLNNEPTKIITKGHMSLKLFPSDSSLLTNRTSLDLSKTLLLPNTRNNLHNSTSTLPKCFLKPLNPYSKHQSFNKLPSASSSYYFP